MTKHVGSICVFCGGRTRRGRSPYGISLSIMCPKTKSHNHIRENTYISGNVSQPLVWVSSIHVFNFTHINIIRLAYFHLQNIHQLHPLFSSHTTAILAQSFF